jgi:hypothetical protein
MNFVKVVPLGTPPIIGDDDAITGSPLLKKNGSNSPYVKEEDVMDTYLYEY